MLQELPEAVRLPGVRVSGSAYASCLMVVEFLQNFGAALGFGKYSNMMYLGGRLCMCSYSYCCIALVTRCL